MANNARLYINAKEGFIGTSLKKDEFVCECSDIDDIIVIRRDGAYLVTKVADKIFVGNDIIYAQVFLRTMNVQSIISSIRMGKTVRCLPRDVR